MRAMLLRAPGEPLELAEVGEPVPGKGQVRLRVRANGVCRTDLHIVDGELDRPKLPLILGHQIVGVVDSVGEGVSGLQIGDRVGVPWLGRTCGACRYCARGRENLCDFAEFVGYNRDGGYAEAAIADAAYCFPLKGDLSDAQVAPLLCGGLIGYRSLRMTNDAERLGFYGFGSAAHIVAQVAVHEGRKVYAFVRPGDDEGRRFALSLGAVWAGGSDERPPDELGAAIIFAPVGALVPAALRAIEKGGTVVCGGIHMSEIPAFSYEALWGERVVRSVANLTRRDGEEFLAVAPEIPIRTEVHCYPLEQANQALDDLRHGRFTGSAVLTMSDCE